MQLKLKSFFPSYLTAVTASIIATLVAIACIAPTSILAANQNTAFLPFKINAPDPQEMAKLSDAALQKELESKTLTMLTRDEAAAIVDYNGSWPPPPAIFTQLAEKTGYDYVAVGSLTQIGDQLSLDIQVFDVLAPSSPHSSYRYGVPVIQIDSLINNSVVDILSYTSRNFLIASIAPAGNERIDSGAILRKISTKAGDFYDPAQLRTDLKEVFAMGYFENVEIEANDTDKGKAITFRVIEKPVINRVLISGADEIEEQDVRDAASIVPNTILNQTRLNEAIQRINELYKSKGYYNTKTTADISYPSEDKAEVKFKIAEGNKIYIGKVAFEGNTSFDDGDLEDVIETGERDWLSWITETGVLKMSILKQDAARIGAYYHNKGFIEAKV